MQDPQYRSPSPPLIEETISILTYDRFGQGATVNPDPVDSVAREPGYGHDFLDVVRDLHELINIIFQRSYIDRDLPTAHILFVGASIGAPIARLYAQMFPETVAGIVSLDSNICNRNYSDFWPNPRDPDLRLEMVTAPDCTLEQYVEATEKLAAIFDLHVKNAENLDRRPGPAYLPRADRPRLTGPGGRQVKVCVVGHDPDKYAQEALETMGIPKSFTARWLQPAHNGHNKQLLEIGDRSGFPEIVIAKGCGHFVQRDNPRFVAQIIAKMLNVMRW